MKDKMLEVIIPEQESEQNKQIKILLNKLINLRVRPNPSSKSIHS